jgi:hypothetical protein
MKYVALEGRLGTPFANAEAIAERLAHHLESIAALHSPFRRWKPSDTRRHRSAVPATLTWPPDQIELRTWVKESAIFESRSGRKQHVGYDIHIRTWESDPIRADFWLRVDFTEGAWWFFNRIGVTFFVDREDIWVALHRDGKNPFAFIQHGLLDLGAIWDCDWAGVYGGDYRRPGERPANNSPPRYKSGWMVYLDQARAARVGNVEDVRVEKLANGGALFTTATDAIFDHEKAHHMAAAIRLQAALGPLNV